MRMRFGYPPPSPAAPDVFQLLNSPMYRMRQNAYKGRQGLLDRAPEGEQWKPPMPPKFGTEGPQPLGLLQQYIPQLSDEELLTLFNVRSL